MQRLNKILLIGLMIVLLSSSVNAVVNDYFAWYKFEADISDETNNWNMTNAGVAIVSGGIDGNKGDFEQDEGDDAGVADSGVGSDMDLTASDACWSFWVSYESADDADRIFRKSSAGSDGWSIQLRTSAAVAECDTGTCVCFIAEGLKRECEGTGTVVLGGGALTHIVVSHDGTSSYFYTNGTLNQASPYGATKEIVESTGTTYMGANAGSSELFDGQLDEVKIFNHNCTASDAQALYDEFAGGAPATNQTPTPAADLTSTGNTTSTVTLSASSTCEEKCLIYQDAVNVKNISSFPDTVTGLTNNTAYAFNFTVYNSTYTTPESNYSNSIIVTTAQTITPVIPYWDWGFNIYLTSNVTGLAYSNTTVNPLKISYNGSTDYVYNIQDFYAFWNFDTESNTNTTDYNKNFNGTVNGATYTTSGKYGGAYTFDGVNDYINISRSPYLNLTSSNMSINLWYKVQNDSITQKIMVSNADNLLSIGSGGYHVWIDESMKPSFTVGQKGDTKDRTVTSSIYNNNDWHMVTAIFNNGIGLYLYVDGVMDNATYSGDVITDITNIASAFPTVIGEFGSVAEDALYFNGTLDEVRIYNRTLTAQEISSLYNTSTPKFTCNFYDNAVLQETRGDLSLNGSLSYNFTLDTTGYEELHDLNVTCLDVQYTTSQQGTDIFIDTITPNVNMLSLENNTMLYYNLNTLINITGTCFDTNLLSCNVTIYGLDGTGTRNRTEATLYNNSVTLDNANITLGIDVQNFSIGRYEIQVSSADDHNPLENDKKHEKAKDIVIDARNLKLKFKVGEVGIYSEDVDEYNVFDEDNKYRVEYNFKKYQDNVIILKDADEWVYRDSEHKAHLSNPKLNKYFDLDSDEITIKSMRIINNEWVITLDTTTKKVKTHSISDLNYVQLSWYFNVTSGYTFYAQDHYTLAYILPFTVTVYNTSGTIQQQSTTTGNMTFNISSGSYATNITSAGYATNQTSNITFTAGGSFTYDMILSNSLLLFIYDEQTNELIDDRNVTIDVINYANTSSTYTTDTGSTFQSNFSAGAYEINYKADNYTARSYYTTVAGSDTQTISLYLLTNTDTTHAYKNIAVLDESASSLSNATVKMQRYYVNDSQWNTVEMSKTNDEGQGFLFTELYDVSYRFVIEYNGVTKKTTSPTKLDTRDLFFSINLLSVGLDSYYEVAGVDTTLSYSNTTKVWTYDFNAVTVANYDSSRFIIKQISETTETVISNQTTASQSGAITFNLTSYTGSDDTFFAYGYVTTSNDNKEYLVEIGSIKFDDDYLNYGLTGLYLSLLIIGTMAFAGLFNPTVAIMLALFGLLITTMTGLLYLTTSWVIGIIIVGIIFILNIKT